MAEAAKPKKSVKPARPPSEIALSAILRMPIGELKKLAIELVVGDKDTAEYLHHKLGESLKSQSTG